MHYIYITFLSTDPLTEMATSTTSVAQRRTVGTRSENKRLFNKSLTILTKCDKTSCLNELPGEQRSAVE